MKFVLLGPATEENLAIGYLSAVLRRTGHTVVPSWTGGGAAVAETSARVVDEHPDVVGLSISFQGGAADFLELAAELRARGFDGHIVAGGHFASLGAEELLRRSGDVDSVLCGEAELSIVALAEALQTGKPLAEVPGIVLRQGDTSVRGPRALRPLDLDALPFPVREGGRSSCGGVSSASLVASRGCRGRCAFCSISAFGKLSDGPPQRMRSPQNIAHEMGGLWRRQGTRFFVFQDDDFLTGFGRADLGHIEALRTAFEAEGLPPVALAIKARPDDVQAEVVAGLKSLGLVQVFLGVETISERGLKAFARGVGPAKVRDALTVLHQAGLFVASNLMLWDPDSTIADLRANLDLMGIYPRQLFNLGRAEAYEGAMLTRRLERKGRLLGEWPVRTYRVADDQAQLAHEIFLTTLAPRCDGIIPRAQQLGTATAVVARVRGGSAISRLARRTGAAHQQLAESNREILASIVEATSLDGRARQAAVAEIEALVRATDDVIDGKLVRLLSEVEAAKPSTRQRTGRATVLSKPARLAVAIAAGAFACSQPQDVPTDVEEPDRPDIVDTGANNVAKAGESATTAPGDAGTQTASPPPVATVKLQTGMRFSPSSGPCRPGHPLPSRVSVMFDLEPSKGTILRFDVTGGTIARSIITPNRLRGSIVIEPSDRENGEGRLDVRFRRPDGTEDTQSAPFYTADGWAFATLEGRESHLNPRAMPEPRRHGCDPPSPRPPMLYTPRVILAEDGRVTFAQFAGLQKSYIGNHQFAAGVSKLGGWSAEAEGGTCDFGRLEKSRPGGYNAPVMPPGWSVFRFLPVDASGSAELQEGTFHCTVSFKLTRGSRERLLSGRLPLHVAADGTITLGTPRPAREP